MTQQSDMEKGMLKPKTWLSPLAALCMGLLCSSAFAQD